MRFIVPDLVDPMAHPKSVRRAVAQRREAVRQAFREHNERICPLLPEALQRLQDAEIHDARIRSLRIDPLQKTLQIRLYSCDASGCFDLILDYSDITLTRQEISLLCLIARETSAEVYWGEVDLEEAEGSPRFIHRILWNTSIPTGREFHGTGLDGAALYRVSILTPEIELRFGGFVLERVPRPKKGEFVRPDDFIVVVRDPNVIEGME